MGEAPRGNTPRSRKPQALYEISGCAVNRPGRPAVVESAFLRPSPRHHRTAGPFPRRPLLLLLVLPLAVAASYEFLSWQAAGGPGFPLDDAWIHAQFARNLAVGRGFTYTGGQWVAGSTAPAWTLLLAAGYAIVPSVIVAGKFIGCGLQALAGYFAARLLWTLGAPSYVAAASGAATAAAPVLVWGAVSGMEVPLAAALVLGGIVWHLEGLASASVRRSTVAILLLALACLARPENLVVLVVVALHFIVRARQPRLLARLGLIVLVVGVTLAPAVWLSVRTIGRPLPTTFYAKSGPGVMKALELRSSVMLRRNLTEHGPLALRQFVATLWDQFSIAAVLVPVGLLMCGWRRRWDAALLLVGLLLLVPFSMGLLAPQRLKPDNVRYVPQLVALAAAVMFVATMPLLRFGRRYPQVASGALLAWMLYRSALGAPDYALAVKNIQQLHVALGRWMQLHLPQGSVVAANDVGAIAFFSGHRILDMEGLVSPEALSYRDQAGRGIAFVEATRPDFIAIFPHWYPEIPRDPGRFTEIHRVAITDNLVSAGDTLIVYRTPWTRHPALQRPRAPRKRRLPA
jgi:hypothetical protein